MSRKILIQVLLTIVILLASFASTESAQAWSNCGGTYVVQWGDTLSKIANACGTTVSALYAANPGLGYYIYAGQVLVMPAGSSNTQSSYTGSYTVQNGDTFAKIAGRYGVSINALWAANPQIWNINQIYVGQVINVPTPSGTSDSSWFQIVSSSYSYEPLVERSYGAVPPKTQTGKVTLANIANAEVYVSLQGTTNDGINVIREYPVEGTMSEKVPVGWYTYVAWVGGQKFSGQFQLHGDGNKTITFYSNRVTVN